jgi:hypothetical protein
LRAVLTARAKVEANATRPLVMGDSLERAEE